MKLDFACTGCGRCCHDLRLQLSVAEALAWLAAGREVQVLSQAVPWPEDAAAPDAPTAHLLARSTPGRSGELPVRWLITLAAHHEGPCPNLLPDLRCGAYASRPSVCRIYPAEISPFKPTLPSHKGCPTEAWAPGLPAMARGGVIVDATLLADIQAARQADREDAPLKAAAARAPGLCAAALVHEGFVVHRPEPAALLAALQDAQEASSQAATGAAQHQMEARDSVHAAEPPHGAMSLSLVSGAEASLQLLAALGAESLAAADSSLPRASYLGVGGVT
jgi:Fe-S-cluster containining protein